MEETPRTVEYSEFIENIKFTNDDIDIYNSEVTVVRIRKLDDEQAGRSLMPLRLEAFSIMLVQEGEINITIDYIPHRIKKNMFLVMVGIHVTNSFYASDDFKGYHVVINREFLAGILKGGELPSVKMLEEQRLNPVTLLQENEFNLLLDIVIRLRNNIRRKEHTFQSILVRNDLSNLIFEAREFKTKKLADKSTVRTSHHHEELVAHFFGLVFRNCRKEHEVSFYATELCVTPVYLSRATKQVTGKTAIKLISDVILNEAKIMLRNPGLSIQQISEDLNFSDQASFSKFFKKHTGKSPLDFRKAIKSPDYTNYK